MLETVFFSTLVVSLTVSAVILPLLLLRPVLGKKYTAKWRYWVWLLIAVRLLIPYNPSLPKAPVSIAVPASYTQSAAPEQTTPNPAATDVPSPDTAQPPQPATLPDVMPAEILSVVWIIGAAAFLLYHLAGYWMFRNTASRFSQPVRNREAQEILNTIMQDKKMKRPIRLLQCRSVQSPMMTGFFRPVLLLPPLEFDTKELNIIFSHELTHYRRKDIWYKLLLICANAVHWFNPLVYAAVSLANRDIEFSCDSDVVKDADMTFRKEYGQAILSAVHKQNCRRPAFSTCFDGGKKMMKKRFLNIFDMQKKHRGTAAFCILLLAVCAAGGLVACRNVKATVGSPLSTVSQSSAPDTESSAISTTAPTTAAASTTSKAASTTATVKPAGNTAATTTATTAGSVKIGAVVYKNTQYGFEFQLPASWNGYKIVEDKWNGTYDNGGSETGPKLIIRNPRWTSADPWCDIPVMVFTLNEWKTVVKGPSQGVGESLFIGAAPIGPTELGRNSHYVFALPARYDFSASEGIEEAHEILSQNPLKPIG